MSNQANICKLGVISFEGRMVIYSPFNNGWAAKDAAGVPIGISDELRAAIEADVEKQKAKAHGCLPVSST